jgi:hypothetical protein
LILPPTPFDASDCGFTSSSVQEVIVADVRVINSKRKNSFFMVLILGFLVIDLWNYSLILPPTPFEASDWGFTSSSVQEEIVADVRVIKSKRKNSFFMVLNI